MTVARVALSVCDRGDIMEKGTTVFQGSSAELRDRPVTRDQAHYSDDDTLRRQLAP